VCGNNEEGETMSPFAIAGLDLLLATWRKDGKRTKAGSGGILPETSDANIATLFKKTCVD